MSSLIRFGTCQHCRVANYTRERGQRALVQRLAEKLATVRNAEGTPPPKQQWEDAKDDASDKV